MDAEELLEGLNEEQHLAVTTEAAPLCIVAGAGSGKTRVLTRRIAYRAATGSLDPRRALVVTFTRAAADELHDRLRRLGLRDRPTAGTFHALAYAQVRRRWAERRQAAPSLLERKAALVARALPRGSGPRVAEVVAEIEWAKARVLSPAAYAEAAVGAGRNPSVGVDAVATAYGSYEAAKRKANKVDFDDLLWLAIHLLETDQEAAAALRWAHQHLFVDELQDVNPLQLRLLEAWRGGRRDLCAVGDPNQAIYAWNGADPGVITSFAERWPGATVVSLPRNHRSSPQVLALANRVLDAGGLPGVRLVATRPDGPEPVVVAAADDEAERAAIVAAVVGQHDRNVPWRHQAVLVRTNAQVVPIAEALQAAGVPVRVRTQGSVLDQPGVKEAIAELRRRGLRDGLAFLEAEGAGEPVEPLDEDSGTPSRPVDEGAAARAEVLRLAEAYLAADPAATAAGFADWVASTLAGAPGDDDAAVVVATFHAAKGLEWPVVLLAGLEDGLVPHARARTSDALVEERRLFHVAITRAERVLHLSWAATRSFDGRAVRRRPSPFLVELEPVLGAMASAASRADAGRMAASARGAVRAARRGSGAPSAGARDDGLARELVAWRSRRARAAGVPAEAVLGDDVVAALCATTESDRATLDASVRAALGPVRAPRLAPELVPIVAAHREVASSSDKGV